MTNEKQKKLETKIINKIFLIGNGFDLALGLKTSYSHFMTWLLKKHIIEAIESERRENPYSSFGTTYIGENINILFNISYRTNSSLKNGEIEKIKNLKEVHNYIDINKISIDYNFGKRVKMGSLFSAIYEKSLNNWVDIEGEYFLFLKKIIEISKSNSKYENFIDQIEDINEELNIIKEF